MSVFQCERCTSKRVAYVNHHTRSKRVTVSQCLPAELVEAAGGAHVTILQQRTDVREAEVEACDEVMVCHPEQNNPANRQPHLSARGTTAPQSCAHAILHYRARPLKVPAKR